MLFLKIIWIDVCIKIKNVRFYLSLLLGYVWWYRVVEFLELIEWILKNFFELLFLEIK